MNINKEFELLRIYMQEYVDKHKRTLSLSYQIRHYNKTGFFIEGHNGKNFIPFNTWKKINGSNSRHTR